MNTRLLLSRVTLSAIIFTATVRFSLAQDPGAQLAAALRGKETGSSSIRVRMQIGDSRVLQVQIKSRVSSANSDVVYQVLFPKERKGEAVLLHRSGDKFTGTYFMPPDTTKPLGEMTQPILGSSLTFEDIVDSPFMWSQQTIVGSEAIDNFQCQILQSKPGKHTSSYASVKTWVDPRRLVPLRIEKYDSSGKVVRRINVTRVLLDGSDSLPADLRIEGSSGAATVITGAGIKRGLNYTDAEFTPEALKHLTSSPPSQ